MAENREADCSQSWKHRTVFSRWSVASCGCLMNWLFLCCFAMDIKELFSVQTPAEAPLGIYPLIHDIYTWQRIPQGETLWWMGRNWNNQHHCPVSVTSVQCPSVQNATEDSFGPSMQKEILYNSEWAWSWFTCFHVVTCQIIKHNEMQNHIRYNPGCKTDKQTCLEDMQSLFMVASGDKTVLFFIYHVLFGF